MIGAMMLRDLHRILQFNKPLHNQKLLVSNLIDLHFKYMRLGTIFKMPDETALLLDDVYSNLIRLQKPIVAFYELSRSFTDKRIQIQEPIYYLFDKEFNKDEELHMYAIRKLRKEQEASQTTSRFQRTRTMPNPSDDLFRIDDVIDANQELFSERKEDDNMESGSRSIKSTAATKKYNIEQETLLTSEDKDFP